jgi:DNA-directed RNA polymerase specialized sigma24 family protein
MDGGSVARSATRDNADAETSGVSALEKVARLLGLFAVKDVKDKTEQVVVLRAAGFEVSEVAALLGMTENHVRVAAHKGRRARSGKKKKKTTKAH